MTLEDKFTLQEQAICPVYLLGLTRVSVAWVIRL